jgi:hypothetical protein
MPARRRTALCPPSHPTSHPVRTGAGGGAHEHAVAGVCGIAERGDLHPAAYRDAESRDVVGQQRLQLGLRHHPRPVSGGVRGEVGIGPVHEVGVEDHSREVPGEPRLGRAPAGTGRSVLG